MTGSNGFDDSAVAVAVGATGQLGGAAVGKLVERGIRVVAVARDAEKLELLASSSELITPVVADISEDSSVEPIRQALGGPVRMAFMGAGLPVRGSAATVPPGDYAVAFNVKVGGFVRLIRATEDFLQPGSRLVTLTGYHATEPRAHETMPGVVNAAMHNLVRQLSELWGPKGITVHAISPGAVDTPRIRAGAAKAAAEIGVDLETHLKTYTEESSLGRFVTLDEVAWSVGLLLDSEAAALHGNVILLDGGRLHGTV